MATVDSMSGNAPPQRRVLVVFDYDWSLVNENSDTYIFKVLFPELLQEVAARRLAEPSWTQLMDDLLGELVQRRPQTTRAEIQSAVAEIPIQPRMLDALRMTVETHGADVKIISDANTVYIASMLEAKGLAPLVTEVLTNPAAFEGDTCRLRVQPYHPRSEEPHGCALCPTNMCKGRILDAIRSRATYDKVLYVGDGSGDYCAATRLTSNDVVFARGDDANGKPYGLLKKLQANAAQIQARVVTWHTGNDIYEQFALALQV